jgi:hypothetical protein
MFWIILVILLLFTPSFVYACSMGLPPPIDILTSLIYERLTADCRYVGINFIGISILIASIFGLFWFGRWLYRLDKH